MKVEVIKCLSHSVELNFGETSVCINTDEAENLIAQLRAVVPVPTDVQGAVDKAARDYATFALRNRIGIPPDEAFKAGIAYERERQEKEAAYFPEYDSIVNKVFGAGNLESWELDEAKRLVSLAKAELLKDLASGPTIKGWISRDGHGSLVFSNEKPSRLEWCGWKLWKISRDTPAVVLPNSLFPSLRWEDEPREIEIIIKEVGK